MRIRFGLRLVFFSAFILLTSSFGVADAAVWFVDKDNASGQTTGLAWETAFTTIQAGIDAAYNDGGGEVWVAEGVYGEERMSYPHGMEAGNTGSIIMKEGVHLYGGFVGGETDTAQRDWEAHVTTLDGPRRRSRIPCSGGRR